MSANNWPFETTQQALFHAVDDQTAQHERTLPAVHHPPTSEQRSTGSRLTR